MSSMITVTVTAPSTISSLTSSSSSSSSASSLRFPSISRAFPILSRPSALCFSGLSESTDCGAGPCLFPLHRCKTIHLVRHAQGIHNVEGDKNYKAYLNPAYFDAHLTPLGWQQVDNLRKHVHASGLMKRIDLVIASPLLRTLQTAVGVFGGEGYTDGTDALPLMVANAGNSSHAAISSLNCPPIVAVELCREHLGVHPCDKRRSISEYQFLFPAIDFSVIDSDEDIWWKADAREKSEELAARGLKFMNWLWTRKEEEIAIVTHRAFLFHSLNAFGNDCHPLVKKEISKPFANCELRSMVIVDRSIYEYNLNNEAPFISTLIFMIYDLSLSSLTGMDASAPNFPGNIPSLMDLHSDFEDDKAEKWELGLCIFSMLLLGNIT